MEGAEADDGGDVSYCRFAWDNSDVYVYESAQGIECCGCRLSKNWFVGTDVEMIAHLTEHLIAGHTVPKYAFDRLLEEIYAKFKKQRMPKWQVKYHKMFQQAVKEAKRLREEEALKNPLIGGNNGTRRRKKRARRFNDGARDVVKKGVPGETQGPLESPG